MYHLIDTLDNHLYKAEAYNWASENVPGAHKVPTNFRKTHSWAKSVSRTYGPGKCKTKCEVDIMKSLYTYCYDEK